MKTWVSEMKKDYEKDENNEINERFQIFRLFRYFRPFRNPSSFHSPVFTIYDE